MTDDILALENQLCFAVVTAARNVVAVYRPVLEPLGLTHPQYLVMLALWERSPRSLGELAGELAMEPATLSPLVKRLEAQGRVLAHARPRRRARARHRAHRCGPRAAGRRAGRAASDHAAGRYGCRRDRRAAHRARAIRRSDVGPGLTLRRTGYRFRCGRGELCATPLAYSRKALRLGRGATQPDAVADPRIREVRDAPPSPIGPIPEDASCDLGHQRGPTTTARHPPLVGGSRSAQPPPSFALGSRSCRRTGRAGRTERRCRSTSSP